MNRSSRAVRWLAIVAILAITRSVEATPGFRTAYGVDSALGGQMNFTQFTVDYNMGMIMLTAKNFSPTITYRQVGLPFEFFYPGNSSGNPTGNGFNYLGAGAWRNAAGTQQLDFLSVNAPFTSIFQPLNPALISVPLTDSIGPFSASVNSTDSVPLVELGDFAPGVSKSFTVNFSEPIGGSPTPFLFVSNDFFVAVPEPSTVVLVGLAGIAIFVGAWRRIPRVRHSAAA
jgi:PEP-CTERM motif-containing protein